MNEKVVFDIAVSPKSSRSIITLGPGNSIKVFLNAPPVDGKANSELVSLFSKKLKIPKSNITIVSGQKGKKKRIAIEGLSREAILEKLSNP
ncbi:MAG: YggU family protein [Spirochaetes bacterium]|nr:YggU family protein [Spirochaetota bacterium]